VLLTSIWESRNDEKDLKLLLQMLHTNTISANFNWVAAQRVQNEKNSIDPMELSVQNVINLPNFGRFE